MMMGLLFAANLVALFLVLIWSIQNDSKNTNGKVAGLFAYKQSNIDKKRQVEKS